MAKIELKNVTVEIGWSQILKDISLTIESGDIVALLGPTNAGKTTLLYTLAGIYKPSKGRIYIDGKDITDLPPQRRPMSMVFQIFALYPNMTVFENIASPLRLQRLSEVEVKKRVMEIAAMLRIEKLLDKKPSELSGGEAQRVVIARALAKNTDILLLDEPLVNLDYKIRESLLSELKRLFSTGEKTIIYATSSPMEASMLAQTLVFIYDGTILQTGPTKYCLQNPVNTTAMRNYSIPPANICEGFIQQIGSEERFTIPGVLEYNIPTKISYSGKVYVGIYPHDISLTPRGDDDVKIKGELLLQEILGSDMVLSVKCKENIFVVYLPYVSRKLDEQITLFINPRNIYLFDMDQKKYIGRLNNLKGGQYDKNYS